MRFPTIHNNGTGKEGLLKDHCAAMAALRDAIDALALTAPNARDYYTQPDDSNGSTAYSAARAEYIGRRERLDLTLTEIETIAEYIADA